MKYVLILTLMTHAPSVTVLAGFTSRDNCESIGREWLKSLDYKHDSYSVAHFTCGPL